MKPRLLTTTGISLAFIAGALVHAEDVDTEITGLESAAETFVVAFNGRDAEALADLFTENGELTDINGEEITSGREEILAHYQEVFSSGDAPQLAVEVSSVRIVAPGLAIEDGTVHLTPPGEDEPPHSWSYCAVLHKVADGSWKIASSRDLRDVSDTAAQLADLADDLKGDWTCMRDGLRLDIAFGWDESGNFLSGEMLGTSADAEPLSTKSRIGWDATRNTITWWNFDSAGGFAKGDWTPVDDGWLVRTEGATSNGERSTANQRLTFLTDDSFLWTSTERVIDGELLPDVELRVVRQAPEPAAD